MKNNQVIAELSSIQESESYAEHADEIIESATTIKGDNPAFSDKDAFIIACGEQYVKEVYGINIDDIWFSTERFYGDITSLNAERGQDSEKHIYTDVSEEIERQAEDLDLTPINTTWGYTL